MITPSLRIKVTDFLATDYEQKVFQELMKIKDDKWSAIVSLTSEDEYHNELNAYIGTLPSNSRDQTGE